jgi:hypothetical protein|tara:strand:+ start:727 stop:918 length:192 start_codon:yes stop_codon:yes gene_type:complete
MEICLWKGQGIDGIPHVFVGKIVGNSGKLFEGYSNTLKKLSRREDLNIRPPLPRQFLAFFNYF